MQQGAIFGKATGGLLLLLLLYLKLAQSHIVGIDLGSDYLKVAKVQSGTGVFIVHNEQSKRKTPSLVAFAPDGSILFGDLAQVSKFPNRTAFYPLEYLHRNKQRRSLLDEQGFSHEFQIYALFLKQALKIANASDRSTDIGLVIPAWFDMEERKSVIYACAIADITRVALIHSNTACAIKYLFDWRPEQPQRVLFVDMGVSSACATIVSLVTEEKNGTISNSSGGGFPRYHLQVHSHTWDKTIGGKYMDERLAEWILQQAANKGQLGTYSPVSIMNHTKCRIRLLQEAKRVKEILSVNQETVASVENIIDSIDIQVAVGRNQVESLLVDRESIFRLINHSLLLANLQKEQIDVVVPFGGTSRIPLVQQIVTQAVKELNKSIHADEAAVYGATFYAALSKRRSEILSIQEWQTSDIWMQMIDFKEQTHPFPLFQIGQAIPSTKEILLHPKGDFDIHIYAVRNESMVYLLENRKSTIQWLGNVTFHVNLTNVSCEYSNGYVRMMIGMNLQGILSPPELEWICTERKHTTQESSNESVAIPTPVMETKRIPLVAVQHIDDDKFWMANTSALQQLQWQLQQRQEKDAMVRKHSDMCNELESRILLYRQRLTEQGHEWNVYTGEQERQKILQNLEQLETWLYGYPEKRSILETSIIQQKQQQIQDWILPIQERIETNQKIQNAVAQLNSTLIFAKQILQAENASKLVEISHLESEVNRWEKWLNTKWNEYIQKAPYEKSRTKILSIDQCDAATKTILNRITQLYKAAEQTTVSKQGDSYPANNNMSTNANTTQDQRNAMETSHDEL